jgi:molybdopterin converting factor small subunit
MKRGFAVLRVHVEILPWLSHRLSAQHLGRLTLTQEVSEGTTVGQVLEALAADNRLFKELIFSADTGQLAGYIMLLLNGRLIELAGGMEAQVQPGDTLRLIPGFSGG